MDPIAGSKRESLTNDVYNLVLATLNLFGDMTDTELEELDEKIKKQVKWAREQAEKYGIEPEEWNS